MKLTGDRHRASALKRNADDILASTQQSSSSSTRFLIMNYYTTIIDYLQALTYLEGYKPKSQDHHKERIEFLKTQTGWNIHEITLLDNIRKIRNDIQYYGTKSDRDIDDFFEMNKESIIASVEKLKNNVGKKIRLFS